MDNQIRTIREVKIFISSPNDLLHEREVCRKTIDELQRMIGDYYKIQFSVYTWEHDAGGIGVGNPMDRIPAPSNFDVYIGMLWNRFGSPIDKCNENGEEFSSGTFQEFTDAYRGCRETGKPDVIFFRKTNEGGEADPEQRRQVDSFFNNFTVGGDHPGIYGVFDSDEALAQQLRAALFSYAARTDPSPALHGLYEQLGISAFYLRAHNDVRNEAKKKALTGAKHIRILAHTCNSYFSQTAQRFYSYVEACLEKGGTVEAIIANPYSEMGYYLTVGDLEPHQIEGATLAERLPEFRKRDIIKQIETSEWYRSKLGGVDKDGNEVSALGGYRRLRRKYGDRIQLRVSSYELDATILIAGNTAFMEPYLQNVNTTRSLNAFEVQLVNKEGQNDVYDALNEYVDFMWNISEDYEAFVGHVDDYKKALVEKMQGFREEAGKVSGSAQKTRRERRRERRERK